MLVARSEVRLPHIAMMILDVFVCASLPAREHGGDIDMQTSHIPPRFLRTEEAA